MARLTNDEEYREELASYSIGLDVERFYDAWRLLIILWRSIWFCSNTDWGRYRQTIWDRFGKWITSAARRSRDLAGFLAVFARDARLAAVGANEEDREWLIGLVALPYQRQRQMIRQLREDTCLLVALVKEFQKRNKEEREDHLKSQMEVQDVEIS